MPDASTLDLLDQLTAFQADDEFERFVHRNHAAFHAYAFRLLGDRGHAGDAVGSALVVLYFAWGMIPPSEQRRRECVFTHLAGNRPAAVEFGQRSLAMTRRPKISETMAGLETITG